MSQARGKTKKLLIALGDVQTLVGGSINNIHNDQDTDGKAKAVRALEKAFDLCVEATGMYDPVE